MALLDNVKEFLVARKGIDRLDVGRLRREQIRLDQVERRLRREIEQIESCKHELFVKGKNDVSSRQRLTLAQKISELDGRARSKQRQLAFSHKHLRLVNGLLEVKENLSLLKRLKANSHLSRTSVEGLAAHIEKAAVEGQLEMERFGSVLGTIQGAMEAGDTADQDNDLAAIVAAMEQAHSAEDVLDAASPSSMEEAAAGSGAG